MNFKKRVNGSWVVTPHYIHNTSADTITTLPTVVYANDTTATVGLKGNMYQASGVSPTNLIQPQECGDLETTGEHAGQYKIPISSEGQTNNIYLGEVETTRKIKKIIFDGQDNAVTLNTVDTDRVAVRKTIVAVNGQGYCSHLGNNVTGVNKFVIAANTIYLSFALQVIGGNTLADVNAYFAQQYAAGTPVTVWYVLANEITGIVNEPLRKIGEYADTVSGISIPTIAGANTLSVGTTLQPSEVTATYKGWHPVQSVHEKSMNLWNEDYTSISTAPIYKAINVGDGDFTLSSNAPLYNNTSAVLFLLAGNVTSGISTTTNGVSVNQSRTVSSINGYVTIAYRTQGTINPDNYNTMLNSGSTALPYEPYWK